MVETTFTEAGDEFGRIARRFDLTLVRQAEPASSRPDSLIIQAALFDSGRPVLIVPYIQKEERARSHLDLLGRQPAGGTRHRGFPPFCGARRRSRS